MALRERGIFQASSWEFHSRCPGAREEDVATKFGEVSRVFKNYSFWFRVSDFNDCWILYVTISNI